MRELMQIETPVELADAGPDAHWVLRDGAQQAGWLSLWWRQTPAYREHRVGLIGHYDARDADAAGRLLRHAGAELAAQGCTLAAGPLDGSTWRRYRLVVESGGEPPFLLEPQNPPDWPQHWDAAGFTPLARYYSALNDDLSHEDPRVPAAEVRLAAAGVTVRTLLPDAYEEELRRIYEVSVISFRENYLYTPLSWEAFLALYSPVRRVVDHRVTLIAEQAGHPVGFAFNLPNLQPAGEPVDTLIVKTVAVLPGRAYAGLGSVLIARSHRLAREHGYRRVIHALMHERNNSRNISNRFARPIRRYALYARELP